MDDELGMDDGECVVGCGCGCGLEDDDERSRMEAYIDEVRAANAAGVAWDESGAWLQVASASEPPTPGVFAADFDRHEDLLTPVLKNPSPAQEGQRRERERERVSGRASQATSPTPTTSTVRKKEKKGKKKARASGLSYY